MSRKPSARPLPPAAAAGRPSREARITAIGRLRLWLRHLYFGRSRAANRLRVAVILIDLAIIGFFIAAPILKNQIAFLVIDYVIAVIVAVELGARALAHRDIKAWLKQPVVWVDIFVLLTLLAPMWLSNLGFLRILRLWTLFHNDLFWRTLGRKLDETRWEELTKTVSTLVTFLFITTGVVYVSYAGRAEKLHTYIDALYFTVATITTTGFGDVTLPGPLGKLLSIAIMICGITLFVRLAQALFRPHKVKFLCPRCGLMSHDLDAVHCKACGKLLNIPNEE